MTEGSRTGILKRQSPGRIIAAGFVVLIFLGSLLLMLPCSVREGVEVRYLDMLYTSTSAVCVTGLAVVDFGSTFTAVGKVILALLVQVGGLGVTAVGAGIIIAIGKRVDLKTRDMVRESMNMGTRKGVVLFVRDIFFTTVLFEISGAVLSFFVFIKKYPIPEAVGYSLFHAIAAFNNSGMDIFGSGENLMSYRDDVLLNVVTCGMTALGGIGFLVIREVWSKRFRWKKFSMHTKVVLSVSFSLMISGTLLLKMTEKISWLGAFFYSVSARTAGFSTYPLREFSNGGVIVLLVLMFIGASPGSTGGGIKTSTLFVLIQGVRKAATNKAEKGFHYAIPENAFRKASVVTMLSAAVIIGGTFGMAVLEPDMELKDLLFEITSAFATVGLSVGITPELCDGSKILSICIMYIGRLGPLTVASLWHYTKGERIRYPEGNISIG
ncbi:MAG: potassium transporter TrkG [Eubacteriales bacterium]|nr:potassium transporter TrkG [Eubacteriales bacterium]